MSGPVNDLTQTLRRELAAEAIDGAMMQLLAACRFLARGDDQYASAAFQRGIDFIKLAAPEIRAIVRSDDPSIGEAAVEYRKQRGDKLSPQSGSKP